VSDEVPPRPLQRNEGFETELRDDEVVCPVTHLTYFKGLKRSPHVDEEGRLV